MLTEDQQTYLKSVARTLQIIVGALSAGVWMFMAVALVLDLGEPENQADEPFVSYLGVGLAALAFVAWAVVPGMIVARMREAIVAGKSEQLTLNTSPAAADLGDVGPLAGVSQSRIIVGSAILEGAAFFNLMAYMLEQQLVNAAVAGLLAVVIMASIPTYGRLEGWMQNELASIEQLRQMRTYDGR
jgi:hypothetical protein